jgi:prepilin-type N-terminal cleavage/methylation domain-containing protein
MIRPTRRSGMTLIELLVTLAILGIVCSVVVLAFRNPSTRVGDDAISQALQARRLALREGRIITIDIDTPDGPRQVSAFPDGSIVADSTIHIGRIDVVEPKRRQ